MEGKRKRFAYFCVAPLHVVGKFLISTEEKLICYPRKKEWDQWDAYCFISSVLSKQHQLAEDESERESERARETDGKRSRLHVLLDIKVHNVCILMHLCCHLFLRFVHEENQGDGIGIAVRVCRTNERPHFQFVSCSQQDTRVSETILARRSLCSALALRQKLAWITRILDVQSIDILTASMINYIRQSAGVRFWPQPVFFFFFFPGSEGSRREGRWREQKEEWKAFLPSLSWGGNNLEC